MALNNHHVDIDRIVCSRMHFSKQRRQTWVPIREKSPGRFPRLARKMRNLRKRRDRIQTGIHWFSGCETPRFLVRDAVLAGPFCCLRHRSRSCRSGFCQIVSFDPRLLLACFRLHATFFWLGGGLGWDSEFADSSCPRRNLGEDGHQFDHTVAHRKSDAAISCHESL